MDTFFRHKTTAQSASVELGQSACRNFVSLAIETAPSKTDKTVQMLGTHQKQISHVTALLKLFNHFFRGHRCETRTMIKGNGYYVVQGRQLLRLPVLCSTREVSSEKGSTL